MPRKLAVAATAWAAISGVGCSAVLGLDERPWIEDAGDAADDTGSDSVAADSGGDDSGGVDSAIVDSSVDTSVDSAVDEGVDTTFGDVATDSGTDAAVDAADTAADTAPEADSCAAITCNTPPAPSCSGSTLTTHASSGTCSGGACSYASTTTNCTFGCAAGACNPDACAGITCNSPPAATCTSSTSLRTYAAGACSNGSCTYAPSDTTCAYGCASGACSPDPCAGVTCTTPPASTCASGSVVTFAATGTCSGGTCSYAPTTTACPSGQTCSGGACVSTTTPPSCVGTAAGQNNCGATSNESCCTSLLVTGVTTASYYRSYDGVSGTSCVTADCNSKSYPAQVSDFRLDKYEVTVGRFRKYVAAVEVGWTPGAGSGKHVHLNGGQGLSDGSGGYEGGWDTSWNTATNFPTASATWDTKLNCDPTYQTWSAGNDNRPINCIDWYDAAAFCIWDGGFLPSEAEWNYAASGGTEQRVYPWGSTAPGANANLAIYGCYYNGTGSCTGVTNIANVGIVPAGNGKYGQSDLAGNVWEWNLDWWNYPYSVTTCTNCSCLVPGSGAVFRGGSFRGSAATLLAGYRNATEPAYQYSINGARCARTP